MLEPNTGESLGSLLMSGTCKGIVGLPVDPGDSSSLMGCGRMHEPQFVDLGRALNLPLMM